MAPTDWFTRDKYQEIVLEPYYRLMSYLCKRLFKDEILSEFAHMFILDIVPAKWLAFDGEEREDQSKNGVFKLISNMLLGLSSCKQTFPPLPNACLATSSPMLFRNTLLIIYSKRERQNVHYRNGYVIKRLAE
jgi:hypothetical protein